MIRIRSISSTFLITLLTFAAGCDDDAETNPTGAGGASTGAGGQGGDGATGGDGEGATGGNPQAGSGGAGGQGGGGSGGEGEGEGGGMGASQACQDCVGDLYTNDPSCAMNIQTCDDDPDCNEWKNCNEACFARDDSLACYQACDAMHPHDTALSQPLLQCTCDACGTVCVNSCGG